MEQPIGKWVIARSRTAPSILLPPKPNRTCWKKKDSLGLYDEGIVDTDLMPIVNSAWKRSIGQIDKNKNAISNRGWCPLNRALLLDPDILASRSSKERSKQYNRMNGIVFSNKMISDENGTSCGSVVNDSSSTIMSIHNNLPNELNFSSSMSGFCLQSILSQNATQGKDSQRSYQKIEIAVSWNHLQGWATPTWEDCI